MAQLRPMRVEDVPEVHDLTVHTFETLDRASGEEPPPRPDPASAHLRYRHLVETDPGGAWVAVDEAGTIVGCALALLREGVWGLSLLVVHPDQQSGGVGGALLRRAHAYADGAKGRIIMATQDPRALRAYFRLGLDLHPAVSAVGTPKVTAPDGLRVGGVEDLPLIARVDRHVRGAAHGPDMEAMLAMGNRLLIAPERGYAVYRESGLRVLAAFDDAAASDLLRGVLARAEGEVTIYNLTALQQWAITVAVDAGLELRTNVGGLFVGGDVGPFTPYLPSGAFL